MGRSPADSQTFYKKARKTDLPHGVLRPYDVIRHAPKRQPRGLPISLQYGECRAGIAVPRLTDASRVDNDRVFAHVHGSARLGGRKRDGSRRPLNCLERDVAVTNKDE